MWLSKGSVPDSLLQPSRRMWRTDGLIVGGVAATTKGIKSLTNWQTYMVRSDSRHLHCLANAGLRLLRAWISHICRILGSEGRGWRQYESVGMCVSVWEWVLECVCSNVWCTLAPVCADNFIWIQLKIMYHNEKNIMQILQQNFGVLTESFFNFECDYATVVF